MSYTPLSPEAFQQLSKIPVVLLLDHVRSRHNVGAVFRSSDAFAIEHVYLCGITPCPPHRAIHQVALGAEHTVAWTAVEDTCKQIQTLQHAGYQVFALEQTADAKNFNMLVLQPDQRYAFVLGNEVFGVSDAVCVQCDATYMIPQYGTKQSLNVATTAGVVLWASSRQLRK